MTDPARIQTSLKHYEMLGKKLKARIEQLKEKRQSTHSTERLLNQVREKYKELLKTYRGG